MWKVGQVMSVGVGDGAFGRVQRQHEPQAARVVCV
jgi:hypothetical protein